MERRSTIRRDEFIQSISASSAQLEKNNNTRQSSKKTETFSNIAFSNDDDDPVCRPAASSPSASPRRKLSRRPSKYGINQFIKRDERRKKDVIVIVVIIMVPIAALIGLTISQVVKSSTIRDDALQAQEDIENFLRVQTLVQILQSERDLSSAYVLSNATDRGVYSFVIGKRQSTDIAIRKLDPWPSTDKSPSYLQTSENLKLFLTSHRAMVDTASITVYDNSDSYSEMMHSIVTSSVAKVKLPEKGDLWRKVWAASELVMAVDPLGVQTMLATVFIRGCSVTLSDKYWFQELTGEHNKHLTDALIYSPDAAQKYQIRAVDSGDEEKNLNLQQQITAGAYEQPCQFANDTVRFGIFWGWNRIATAYIAALRDVSENLAMETRDELDTIVDDAEREFLIYLVVLCVFVLGCLALAIWTTYSIYKMIGQIITYTKLSEETSREVAAEKRRGDLLLYDILPPAIVDDIKRGKDVQVEYFDAVTISYLDIVGFVAMIAECSPVQVVTLLNSLYKMFDDTIESHNVHKIEQNNDVYCVASGVPVVTNKHTMSMCDFLLEIMDKIPTFKIRSLPDVTIQVRAGAHTGPCAAGIVGTTIPRYSVFGETVKMASRMSRTGEVMKIQISDTMKSALHARCGQLYFVKERGEVDIYGKGKIKTHFLLGRTSGNTTDLD